MNAVRYLFFLVFCCSLYAGPNNIAGSSKATASSFLDESTSPDKALDGIIRVHGKGEWVSKSNETHWGQINYPWIQLNWDTPVNVNKIIIYDRADKNSHIAGGILWFSDGSKIDVREIPNGGKPKVVEFSSKKIEWVKFESTDAVGKNLGLSEIEVYPAPEDYTDYVSWVDPYIESARGRYFFFITGNQPFGMIGAAPLTRNKNQYGGGYNYNSTEVLGFPQIHCWMLSGLTLMPAADGVEPVLGENHWKSPFTHDGEIVQPGYHRLYLEKYNLWVEQTATDRTSFYRLTHTKDAISNILLNLGGYVGTSTMVNAKARKTSDHEIAGSFDTVGRLWGGPNNVKIFFVARFNKPFEAVDGWSDQEYFSNIEEIQGPSKTVARNQGKSYHNAPPAGFSLKHAVKAGDQILVKMAVSYVSEENARENLEKECDHWDFDRVRSNSQKEWNEWLGKIDVKGGSHEQRIKFYTDLWHTLLGRHKIDDWNGQYPDRTGKDMVVRELPKGSDDHSVFHMYNSDAFWLTQWNLNTLWGLAYPDVLDDFAACLIQYDLNGGLLPRGPSGGGYSFIMSGCPATSLITSAYQRGIDKKWSPEVAYESMKRNHEKGGMLAYRMDDSLDFYIKHGYCPGNAGLTIQWAVEDWALGEMAAKMGKKEDADYYHKRAEGWPASFNKEIGLVLPKKADGNWLHLNPLSGRGYIEANAWQATFGLSHDLAKLAEMMGGTDRLCDMLNEAFEKSRDTDFVFGYSDGYVSYANQPGCSNAHVFSHAGKPWLTQYWVRRVKEQAHGAITPDKGYGGHDEDQGQMGGISALMAIGLFSIDGGSSQKPMYDITSPVFDEVTIKLDRNYYNGKTFVIKTYNNSAKNCYIQKAKLNGKEYGSFQLPHALYAEGGVLELWMGDQPNKKWGH